MNKITYLDGMRWYRALIAGIRHVIARQDYLNNINVFPVPDRDTGTNMALTLSAVIEGTFAAPKHHLPQLFTTIAESALSGARGNSGTILAQFFQGMAEGIDQECGKMEPRHFAVAVSHGVQSSYNALSQPKEGTILTVLKDFSLHISQTIAKNHTDFVNLLHLGLDAAKKSLQKTTQQLKELKKAHVVDAGAQGFVDLLQGIYDFIHHGSLDQLEPPATNSISKEQMSQELSHAVDEAHRFCTECLITADHIDQHTLRQTLENLGDSLVVAGSKKKAKVHIHTNNPAHVFAICRTHGHLQDEKADDMIQQQRAINHQRNEVAILTDSGADLPQELIAKLDIHVVPLQLFFDKQCFIDKVTITSEEFYQLLKTNPHHPTTSQPSLGDFYRQYQYLSSHYPSIIAIHLARKISGTISASEQAAQKIGLNNIAIFDAQCTSVAQGLLVQLAAEAAKRGAKQQEILELLTAQRNHTKFYAAIPDLTYMTRGGRLSTSKKRLLEFLHLVPIISFKDEGKPSLITCLWRKRNLSKKLAKLIQQQTDLTKTYRILVSHCDNESAANELKHYIEKFIPNIESITLSRTGATLGAHGGPQTFGLALQPVSWT
ncbi:MAG: hypothetical protein A3F17_08835 [Gammaproteobacteria bacterium RIFCSPHIGHO2_12_FULL_41_15]|nr:MAG: hypothetical protein A3F17_08835 [Gammaproteobacteria bacterium RIFCSPHIGHO2_12_FULL_41_15]